MFSESLKFTSLYQGRYSNFQEGDNLTTQVEDIVDSREIKEVELFVLTDELVFESLF